MSQHLTRKNHLSRHRKGSGLPLSIVIPNMTSRLCCRSSESLSPVSGDDRLPPPVPPHSYSPSSVISAALQPELEDEDDALTTCSSSSTLTPSGLSCSTLHNVLFTSSTLSTSSNDDHLAPLDGSPLPHDTPPSNAIYSNFYLKLPNGKWRVRCRTGDRKIIGTYELDGFM
ncbi:hypothetical protein DM01DRAFT_1340916, partial [Hesseltinella vesiculosa]